MILQPLRTICAVTVIPLILVGTFACSDNGSKSGSSGSDLSEEAVEARERLDTLLTSFIGETNIVNTMISVSNDMESGSFSVQKGEASPGVPMTEEHQFHIASMSKPFTATLLLQLVEEG